MRRAAKRDRVEVEIVRLLRASGFSVEFLSGDGVPDLLCGRGGLTVLIEVKTGNKKLRPSQVEWHDGWRGARPHILRSVDDAEAFVKGWPSLAKI